MQYLKRLKNNRRGVITWTHGLSQQQLCYCLVVRFGGSLTGDAVRIAAKMATKDNIKELRSEIKLEHASLSDKVEKLNEFHVRHLEYHAGYKHKK